MITSLSLKRTAKVAVLTVAFAASGSAVAMAGTTSGNNSILGGNQISVPVSIPVNVCGNALAILGDAFGGCQGGASVLGGSGGGWSATSGDNSIGGGNQISVPISVPVNVCGNSAGVLGTAASGCKGGSSTGTTGTPPPCNCKHHHPTTPTPGKHHHHKGTGGGKGHHGGTGTTSGSTPETTAMVTGASALPTTGANFLGLLALAGGVTVSGAGCLMFAARRRLAHGVLAVTRRVTGTAMAS